MTKPTAILIAGPTTSGKSALASRLIGAASVIDAGPARGVGFDDAGNVLGSWTGKMMVRRWTKN